MPYFTRPSCHALHIVMWELTRKVFSPTVEPCTCGLEAQNVRLGLVRWSKRLGYLKLHYKQTPSTTNTWKLHRDPGQKKIHKRVHWNLLGSPLDLIRMKKEIPEMSPFCSILWDATLNIFIVIHLLSIQRSSTGPLSRRSCGQRGKVSPCSHKNGKKKRRDSPIVCSITFISGLLLPWKVKKQYQRPRHI